MRRLSLLLLCVLVLSMITGCAGKATPTQEEPSAAATEPSEPIATTEPSEPVEAPEEPVRIALFIPVLGNTYNEAIVNGAKDAAAEMNATVEVFSAEYDAARQVAQMQDALVAGTYDVFIVNPVDGMVILPEIDDAVDAGIVVGSVDAIIGPNTDSLEPYDGMSVVAAVTGEVQGLAFGNKIVEACGDKDPCRVAYLIGMQALTIDQKRLLALHSVVDAIPSIEIVAEQEASYLQDKGLSVMQNILEAYPDIDVISSSGDQMSIGAAQAVADAGIADNVIILGNGASVEGVKAVKDGVMQATFALIPYTEGKIVAEWLIKGARGEEVRQPIDMSTVSPPLPASGPWIDAETAGEFTAEW